MKGCNLHLWCWFKSIEDARLIFHKISGRTPQRRKRYPQPCWSRTIWSSSRYHAWPLACQSSHYGWRRQEHVYLEKPTSHNPGEWNVGSGDALNITGLSSRQPASFVTNVIKAIEEIKLGQSGKWDMPSPGMSTTVLPSAQGKNGSCMTIWTGIYGKVLPHGCPI